jgi:hypothetical protein
MKLYEIIHKKYLKLTEQLREIEDEKINFILITNTNESGEKLIELQYKNKRLLYGHYEILGVYDIKNALFEWAWNFQLDKKIKSKIKNIKSFGEKLLTDLAKNKYEDVDFLEKNIYYTTRPIIFIDSKNIPDLIEIANYIMEGNGILSSYSDNTNERKRIFYVITDIIG